MEKIDQLETKEYIDKLVQTIEDQKHEIKQLKLEISFHVKRNNIPLVNDSIIVDNSVVEMKKKIIDKIVLEKHYKILEEDSKLINEDKRFVEWALEYNVEKQTIRNKFSRKTFPYALITLNPDDDSNEWKQIDMFVRKWIKKIDTAMWVYEQRGKNILEANGFHCHILIKRMDEPRFEQSKFWKHLLSQFKGLWINSKPNFSTLNIKYIAISELMDRVCYINGMKKKKPLEQKEKMNIDKLLRQEFGYDDVYFKGHKINSDTPKI